MFEWEDRNAPDDKCLTIEAIFLFIAQAVFVLSTLTSLVTPLSAHSGGLTADGCHNDRKNGGRHCHRGGAASAPKSQNVRGSAYYPNCAAARAAGAAPIRVGEPGYASHLDRDGDGVACE